ncbi:MAG TPA: Rho termination factor N-terminal domain-containing protein [Solirubrobacteraceae bacterium]|nr:Rho termination factor N-terminal domain-containing protein [Solirubrobacteraceae bacterium]
MTVLDRSELESSSLADLHAIADQLGLEGFRRLRKAELIDTILGDGGGAKAPAESAAADGDGDPEEETAAKRRPRRSSRARTRGGEGGRERSRSSRGARTPRGGADEDADGGGGERAEGSDRSERGGRAAEGVVELLGNGSAFLRVDPPEASDEDVYISAAQVRRCELVSGDRVKGPVRMPRRSERYPSLVRIEEINGSPAGEVAAGERYDERPVAYPSERLELGGEDGTLQAIEWLTPFGKGSRVVIAGPSRAGKSQLLRTLAQALSKQELETSLLLTGVRPEELAEWGGEGGEGNDGGEEESSLVPTVSLTFAVSPDAQGQAVENALETAKRTAARGGDALVLIDSLDGLPPHTARKVLAAARNLREGGSLTILATATKAPGGETTVIVLDPELALGGGPPLDLIHSGTLRAELLVGEDGAQAIAQARAGAFAQARGDGD